MKTAILIPARYDSSRFRGKVLKKIMDRSMIEMVYTSAVGSKKADFVAVLTDDERVKKEVESFGGSVFIVKGNFSSGTDRVAHFAADQPFEYIVNLQADEPLIDPETIDALIECLMENSAEMATLASICEEEAIDDANTVKVVTDTKGWALYFSRSRIPFNRNPYENYLKHIGIYAYTKETLLFLSKLKRGSLEEAEGLEQLRALENGIKIRVCTIDKTLIGVDTPEDLQRVINYLKETRGNGSDRALK